MSKEKFSISMDDLLVKWVDEQIKEKIFATRSHAIEFAVNTIKKQKN